MLPESKILISVKYTKRDRVMKKLNEEDIQAYFQAGNSGFWKVEFEEGKKTRLYTDEITNELFGITEAMFPENAWNM